jgi:hypothetical protein
VSGVLREELLERRLRLVEAPRLRELDRLVELAVRLATRGHARGGGELDLADVGDVARRDLSRHRDRLEADLGDGDLVVAAGQADLDELALLVRLQGGLLRGGITLALEKDLGLGDRLTLVVDDLAAQRAVLRPRTAGGEREAQRRTAQNASHAHDFAPSFGEYHR